MADQSGLRQRKISGLPLNNTDVGSQISDTDFTPTPTSAKQKFMSLHEFKSKQQSFDIAASAVDECEEEEIALDSDDEGTPDDSLAQRPITPTPLQDFGVSVQHSEVPMTPTEFLKANPVEQDCFTDVSDAEDDEGGEEE